MIFFSPSDQEPFLGYLRDCHFLGCGNAPRETREEETSKPPVYFNTYGSPLPFLEAFSGSEQYADNHLETYPIRAAIVPHHLVAAESIARVFSALSHQSVRHIILISPDHFFRCATFLCTTDGEFHTLFGNVQTDTSSIKALEIIEKVLQKYGAPVYVNHDLVHNRHVVQKLEEKGVIFSKDLEQIPKGSVYLFSAHGVSPGFRAEVESKSFHVIDATCPLVTKVHRKAEKYANENAVIFFIGHKGHPEAEGTTGVTKMHLVESREDAEKINPSDFPKNRPMYILTQTTLSLDDTAEIISALQKKFPHIKTSPGKDICYATANRQTAVKELAKKCDFIIIVGSKHSSNSNRLVETAKSAGTDAILLDDFSDIQTGILENITTLGISSGASVPDILVERLIDEIQKIYPQAKTEVLEILKENVEFALPKI